MSILHIQLLGHFRLVYGNISVVTINTPRLQALLAHLLLYVGVPQLRQEIAFHFWPDSSEAHARNSLRNLLHRLRHALPAAEEWFQIDDETLVWRAGAGYTLDVAAFDGYLAQATSGDEATMPAPTAFIRKPRSYCSASWALRQGQNYIAPMPP